MKTHLDYTNPGQVVNFRDVGDFVNLITGKQLMPVNRLFRGGTIKYIADTGVIENPRTIICLQKGADPALEGIQNIHFSISNDYEKYETKDPHVRRWLRDIVKTIETGVHYPLYIHCLSGKDRTGVVVASLLKIVGLCEEDIIEEYSLSAGIEGLSHIQTALHGMKNVGTYFKGIDLGTVRASLLGETD